MYISRIISHDLQVLVRDYGRDAGQRQHIKSHNRPLTLAPILSSIGLRSVHRRNTRPQIFQRRRRGPVGRHFPSKLVFRDQSLAKQNRRGSRDDGRIVVGPTPKDHPDAANVRLVGRGGMNTVDSALQVSFGEEGQRVADVDDECAVEWGDVLPCAGVVLQLQAGDVLGSEEGETAVVGVSCEIDVRDASGVTRRQDADLGPRGCQRERPLPRSEDDNASRVECQRDWDMVTKNVHNANGLRLGAHTRVFPQSSPLEALIQEQRARIVCGQCCP